MSRELSEYEQQRARNIARNQEQLAQLGLVPANPARSSKAAEEKIVCELCGKRTKKRHVCMVEDENGVRRPIVRDRSTVFPQRETSSRASKGKAPIRLGFVDGVPDNEEDGYGHARHPSAAYWRPVDAAAWASQRAQDAESDDGGAGWDGARWIEEGQLDEAVDDADQPPEPAVEHVLRALESAATKRLWMPHTQPTARKMPRVG